MADDLESLNLADMDIEQLEQRIELGIMIMQPIPGECVENGCKTFSQSSCGINKCNVNTN